MSGDSKIPGAGGGAGLLEAIAKVALAYGTLLLVWAPALGSDRVNDSFQDWSYGAEYRSYATTALFDFGEVPYFAWQGRHKGHRNVQFDAFFANPETPVFSPLLPLYRVLDHEEATRAERRIRLLVGTVGGYVLLSAWLTRVSLWALLAFCLLFFGNGAVAGHVLVGHGMAGALFAVPLALGLFLRATQIVRERILPPAAVGCGALLAVMAYDGASHFLTHFLLFLLVYSLIACAIDPSRTRATAVALLTSIASFLVLGAYKLLPMIDVYAGYAADYRMGYASLQELLLQFRPFTPETGFEHELNSYVGIAGTALFAAALFRWTRATVPFLLTGLLFLLLTWLPVASWLAQNAPFFETQGVFSRFRVGFLFAFACLAAALLDRAMTTVRAWGPSSRRTAAWVLAGALLVGLAVDLHYQNFERRREALLLDPYPPIAAATIAPLPFLPADGDVEIRPVRRGVNWAEYRYRSAGTGGSAGAISSPVLEKGVGHLVFSGDVRVSEEADGPVFVLTRRTGSFRYEFRHRAATVGGWITTLALASAAVLGLRWLFRRVGASMPPDGSARTPR